MKILVAASLVTLPLAFVACTQALPAPDVPRRDPAAERRLNAAVAEHTHLVEQLSEVPTHRREKCEFQSGDCLILVGEERDRLLSEDGLRKCSAAPDPAARTRCIADELVRTGRHADLASMYEYDSACTRTLLECTADLEARAAADAVEARAEARRHDLEISPEGAAAGGLVDAARARSEYLRATLPPEKASACDLSDTVDACVAGLAKDRAAFEAELRKDDYSAATALELYRRRAAAEAQCHDPELACLARTLEPYGLFPESKQLLTANLNVLQTRSELARRTSPKARTACLTRASADHQDRIVQSYVRYAHEPVLFFRMQLEKAFLAMHEEQVQCLTHRVEKPATTAHLSADAKPAR